MDLFSRFQPATKADWEAAVSKELKGETAEKLHTRTEDGLALAPYYSREDLQPEASQHLPGDRPYRRGLRANHNDWVIFERLSTLEPEAANRDALHALMHGAEGLIFEGPVADAATFGKLTHELLPQYLILIFRHADPVTLAGWLKAWSETLELPSIALRGATGYDPLGDTAFGERSRMLPLGELVRTYQRELPGFLPLSVRVARYRAQGASLVQELGIALALGNAYLGRLLDDGLHIDEATPALQFELSAGTDYFAELVKFRAFRQLWAGLVNAYEPSHSCTAAANVLAVSSTPMLSAIDPHTNLLRLTTAAMSAALGGVHGLELHPFDQPVNGGSALGAELSRNIQLLLKNEAYFDKVVDPAAGSYYLESLTDQLSEQAWAFFQRIEAQGGFEVAAQSGWLMQEVEAHRTQLEQLVAGRRKTLVGVNQYPDTRHAGIERTDDGSFRLSGAFEELRAQTAAASRRPKVFLLPMGDLGMRLARATFASNFFGCAGYEIIENNGFSNIKEGTAAALASGADIVVLCSSDAEYPSLVADFCTELNGKSQLVLAGYPKDEIETYRQHGIQHFIHVKANLLETLQSFQKILSL